MFAQAGGQGRGRGGQNLPAPIELAVGNAMNNPFRMLESWPHLGAIKPGAAIGIVPDGKGGVWLQHRSVPAILHLDPSGNIVKTFDAVFAARTASVRTRTETSGRPTADRSMTRRMRG